MGALDRIFRGRRGGQERPLAAQIAALFANGEQGLWYDPTDVSTLYQDSGGTTPAYRPGQGQVDPPVGLVLDKRKGLVRGPEAFSDASIAFTGSASRVSAGVYRIYSSDGSLSYINQSAALTVGKWYEIKFSIDSIATLGAGVSVDQNGVSVLTFTTTGSKSAIFLATFGDIALKRQSGVTDIQISGVSVRELPGNHAYQTTTASRPTLSARYNLLTSSENMAGAVWSKMGVTTGADYITESSAFEDHYATQSVPPLPVGTKLRGRAEFKPRTGARNAILRFAGSNGSAYTIVDLSSGAVLLTSVTGSNWSWVEPPVVTSMGDGYYSITGFVTTTEPSGAIALWPGMTPGTSLSYLGDGVSSIYIRNTDLRAANDGVSLPPYQRVVDANTYDAAGFPLYLKFDGVDDWLQTASVDFSASDKLIAVVAFRKLSDAATGCLVELSAWSGVLGGVSIQAPRTASSNLAVALRDASNVAQYSIGNVASPASSVLSANLNISAVGIGNQIAVRLNGGVPSLSVSSSATVVASAFANAPFYIGRRNGTSLPFNGRLYGLLIRAGAANDSQILKVEKYLNQKAKVA